MKKIIVIAGTTGGHVSPVLAILPMLREKGIKIVCWVGVSDIEKKEAKKENIPFEKITSGHFRSKNFFKMALFPLLFIFGLIRSISIVLKYSPKHLFSTGTYFSIPMVLAGKIFGCKVIIHEQTMNMGLANKVCSFFANSVLLSFHESYNHIPRFIHKRCIVVGNPIRDSLINDTYRLTNLLGKNISKNLPILYVSPGSLGRADFQDLIININKKVCESWFVIYHRGQLPATGISHQNFFEADDVSEFLGSIYNCCDFAISSCGANTLNELSFFKIPSLLIPLKKSRFNEQFENAIWFTKNNDGVLLSPLKINSEDIIEILETKLLTIRTSTLSRDRKKRFLKNGASEKIVKYLFDKR